MVKASVSQKLRHIEIHHFDSSKHLTVSIVVVVISQFCPKMRCLIILVATICLLLSGSVLHYFFFFFSRYSVHLTPLLLIIPKKKQIAKALIEAIHALSKEGKS